MMEEKLKPCPLCGGNDVKLIQPPHQNYIECLECEATGPNLPTAKEAIAAWNRRDPHADLVAALKAALPLLEENQERLERSYMPEPSETEAEMLTAYSEAIEKARAALREVREL